MTSIESYQSVITSLQAEIAELKVYKKVLDHLLSNTGKYVGKICKHHPEINGVRYESNSTCVLCAKECSARQYKERKLRKVGK